MLSTNRSTVLEIFSMDLCDHVVVHPLHYITRIISVLSTNIWALPLTDTLQVPLINSLDSFPHERLLPGKTFSICDGWCPPCSLARKRNLIALVILILELLEAGPLLYGYSGYYHCVASRLLTSAFGKVWALLRLRVYFGFKLQIVWGTRGPRHDIGEPFISERCNFLKLHFGVWPIFPFILSS